MRPLRRVGRSRRSLRVLQQSAGDGGSAAGVVDGMYDCVLTHLHNAHLSPTINVIFTPHSIKNSLGLRLA